MQTLVECLPSSALIYFFGFLIVFSYFVSGFFSLTVCALTSAVLLSGMVVSMAMPELKRKPVRRGRVFAELTDGSFCQIAKPALDLFLEHNRIARFKRADSWVVVDKGCLRDMKKQSDYAGVDRREAV